jgi:hypothetical protein
MNDSRLDNDNRGSLVSNLIRTLTLTLVSWEWSLISSMEKRTQKP